jgi:hypothetical protein
MLGVVLVLVAMFVVGPIAVFLAGAVWSGLFGWAVGDNVAVAAETPTDASS